MSAYAGLSFWHATVGDDLTPRPSLPGDTDVDVAIVGGGYTGLWTAYYLAVADPSLRVALLESEIAGFGASGRNGGWCSAHFSTSHGTVARLYGRDRALQLARALSASVDEVGRVATVEGIGCDYVKGGQVRLSRSPTQLARAHAEAAAAHGIGLTEHDLRVLSRQEAEHLCGATDVLGATYTPHCAVLHPARLVRGLARTVEQRGVRVYECTPVTRIGNRVAHTPHGRIRADVVVRATEAYTARLPGQRRTLAPVYSLMLATEPLPRSFWDAAGLRAREAFSDLRHVVVYGQRTADDRLAFGGRGAPYHFGSATKPAYDQDPNVHKALHRVLVDMFPAVADETVTHTWGGPLGIPRDWFATVSYDREAGLAWAGGYVGQGVGASNLAGRSLADLLLDRNSDLVHLPWVDHRSRRWEPEPLRWLGVNAGRVLASSTDAVEWRTGREPRRAALLRRLVAR